MDIAQKLHQTSAEQRERFQKATEVSSLREAIVASATSPAPAVLPERVTSSAADLEHYNESVPRAVSEPTSTPRKASVVRDTFSMPPSDSELIDSLRSRAARHGRICFRSEIVRAALRSLAGLDEVKMIAAVDAVERVDQGSGKGRSKG